MRQTVGSYIEQHDNDYTPLEMKYRQVTGAELVRDPYASVRCPVPDLTLSMSVVIPAWNALGKIERCLRAIEYSTFNLKYPTQLEVVVVDDGSPDGLWEALQEMSFNLNWKAVRQRNYGRGFAVNTGGAVANGDVLVVCDPDIILSPFSLEELAKRHQVLDKVVLLGFRGEIASQDWRINLAALPQSLPNLLAPFTEDVRVHYPLPGWPQSICRETDHLKRLGGGRQLLMSDGRYATLPTTVLGFLFSLSRQQFLAIGGHDERFAGYGWEDVQIGAAAISAGNQVIPVYSAVGHHITHPDLSASKRAESNQNYKRYQSFLDDSLIVDTSRWLKNAKRRIKVQFEKTAVSKKAYNAALYLQPFNALLTTSEQQGLYYYALGRYQEAATSFAAVEPEQLDKKALLSYARTLCAMGEAQPASDLLLKRIVAQPEKVELIVELAKVLAALGKFKAAQRWLGVAHHKDKQHASVQGMVRPIEQYLTRAEIHLGHGFYQLARWDYEAALTLDPKHKAAYSGWEKVRAYQDEEQDNIGAAPLSRPGSD